MKKWLIVGVLASCLLSCVTVGKDTDTWLEFEVAPSRISYFGNDIMWTELDDGAKLFVFRNLAFSDEDDEYYYTLLMQDFGWISNGDKWSRQDEYSRRPNLGSMYVNPRKEVAVYFSPDNGYGVFKVRIE